MTARPSSGTAFSLLSFTWKSPFQAGKNFYEEFFILIWYHMTTTWVHSSDSVVFPELYALSHQKLQNQDQSCQSYGQAFSWKQPFQTGKNFSEELLILIYELLS